MDEAYSHECSSCGFWPGGGPIAEPAFYSYAYPGRPDTPTPVRPKGRATHRDLGEFLLPLRSRARRRRSRRGTARVLQSTYEAAAELGGWDRSALERL